MEVTVQITKIFIVMFKTNSCILNLYIIYSAYYFILNQIF